MITGVANTAQAGTLIRAEEQFGVSIPTIAAPHFTIWPLSLAM